MLAGLGREHGHDRMPMIRRSNGDRVDALIRNDLPKILVRLQPLAASLFLRIKISHALHAIVQSRVNTVRNGDHLRVIRFGECAGDAGQTPAHADETERDAIVGALAGFGGAPHAGWQDERRADNGGSLKESTA